MSLRVGRDCELRELGVLSYSGGFNYNKFDMIATVIRPLKTFKARPPLVGAASVPVGKSVREFICASSEQAALNRVPNVSLFCKAVSVMELKKSNSSQND